jgi:hypothetical protein
MLFLVCCALLVAIKIGLIIKITYFQISPPDRRLIIFSCEKHTFPFLSPFPLSLFPHLFPISSPFSLSLSLLYPIFLTGTPVMTSSAVIFALLQLIDKGRVSFANHNLMYPIETQAHTFTLTASSNELMRLNASSSELLVIDR